MDLNNILTLLHKTELELDNAHRNVEEILTVTGTSDLILRRLRVSLDNLRRTITNARIETNDLYMRFPEARGL